MLIVETIARIRREHFIKGWQSRLIVSTYFDKIFEVAR